MAITGKVKTLFEDKERTQAIFPRTVFSAVTNEDGESMDELLTSAVCIGEDLTKTYPLSVNADTLGGQSPDYYAKASEVENKNKQIRLGNFGSLGENTLSDYVNNYEEILVYSNFTSDAITYVLGSIRIYSTDANDSDLKFIICMNDGTVRKTQFYFYGNKIYIDKLDNVTSVTVYGITKGD